MVQSKTRVLSTAALTIALVLSLIALIVTIEPIQAQSNQSSANNNSSTMMKSMNSAATSASNATAANLTSLDTFSASGSISSLQLESSNTTTATHTNATTTNATTTISGASVLPPKTFILSGFWHLKVNNGKLASFDVRFTKVHIDATNRHTHEITNLTLTDNNDTSIKLNANGTTTIKGTTGVALNNIVVWKNVKTTITINDASTIIISLDPKDTSNHFAGQSIYGIVDMVKDKNGKDLVHFPSIIHI